MDEATGTVTLRSIVPNPQQGITRDAKGNATALVVGNYNKVASRQVTVDRVIGSRWLVSAGLQAGDQVIVEGTSKVQVGMTVKAVETDTSSSAAQATDDRGGE
ncbi:Multidrug resistance protein MexA precursor [Sodalis glossinidius str. 'morsitans']|uniref:Multidrug resistance protein MexA n=1 Tax=Sodalis glossinidius (strain morsitans) TaxID=343509 RepID=A0A193QLP6_SODGM|nr:Multidrug resistance protein MexA precursor [Sodalis glossinidius str. 'morsitans']